MEALELSKVCRLCLRGEEVMCPIFSSAINGSGVSLSLRIMSCAQVKLSEGDGLPSNVCTSCLSQVDRSYQFKLLCERSDTTLRATFKSELNSSDTESLDGGEPWDMTKFTPEVIIKEDTEENNLNGGLVEPQNEYPHLAVPPQLYPIASLGQHWPEIKPDDPPSDSMNGRQHDFPRVQQTPTNRSRRCRGGDKLFKCRQCNKSYSFSSALSRHKAVHNTALRPHVCQICNKGFTQVDKLLRHQKTHTIDIFMACDLCKRPFKSFASYQKHRMSGNCNLGVQKCLQCCRDVAEGELHSCALVAVLPTTAQVTPAPAPSQPQAGSDSQEDVSLTDPSDGKKGKGKPEFKCGVCSKNFATRGSLEVHSTIHTGVRPFVCSVCDKSFRHKVNLMEHYQRKHSQVRPYICDVCAARFVTKQELVRHYRKHIGD